MNSGIGKYEITTPAASDPVTLTEAKLWCKIDTDLTADDALVTALITAATEICEKYTGRVFMERTIEFSCRYLAVSTFEEYAFVDILRAPFISLTAATVVNDGSPVSILSDTGIVDGSGYPRVLVYDVTTLPDDEVAYPYVFTFTAGYGSASDVPEDIKTAVKEVVNFLYENRGDVEPGNIKLPLAAKTILNKYRIYHSFTG